MNIQNAGKNSVQIQADEFNLSVELNEKQIESILASETFLQSIGGTEKNENGKYDEKKRQTSVTLGKGIEVIPKPVFEMLNYHPNVALKVAMIDMEITFQFILEENDVDYGGCSGVSVLLKKCVNEGILTESYEECIDEVLRCIKEALQSDPKEMFLASFKGVHLAYRVINMLVKELLPKKKAGVYPWF